MTETPEEITTRPLTARDWEAIETLFGKNGACGGCWCMFWRAPSTGKYWEEHKGEKNRTSFKALVESGSASGILAFKKNEPIGWCSVGPRADFAYLARARKIPPAIDSRTWSITCYFVERRYRNCGVSLALTLAAVDFARKRQGSILEAYPTTLKAADIKLPDAFAHNGVSKCFESAGFVLATRAGARSIYRKIL